VVAIHAGDNEEAVKRGVEHEVLFAWGGAPDHGPELAFSGVMAKCEETGVTGGSIVFGTKLNVDDDGERRLACVVVEHEFAGGGGAAPRPADGAAAEDILGRQP
jgi:hypothetical protein